MTTNVRRIEYDRVEKTSTRTLVYVDESYEPSNPIEASLVESGEWVALEIVLEESSHVSSTDRTEIAWTEVKSMTTVVENNLDDWKVVAGAHRLLASNPSTETETSIELEPLKVVVLGAVV